MLFVIDAKQSKTIKIIETFKEKFRKMQNDVFATILHSDTSKHTTHQIHAIFNDKTMFIQFEQKSK